MGQVRAANIVESGYYTYVLEDTDINDESSECKEEYVIKWYTEETDSVWQGGVYDALSENPPWRGLFVASYEIYREYVDTGADMGFMIDAIAITLATFLSICREHGSDASDLKDLSEKDFCATRLKALKTEQLKLLLKMFQEVLGYSISDKTEWIDKATKLLDLDRPYAIDVLETPIEHAALKIAMMAAWETPYEGALHQRHSSSSEGKKRHELH